eukprot:6642464-Prymnesium_polylepis.1
MTTDQHRARVSSEAHRNSAHRRTRSSQAQKHNGHPRAGCIGTCPHHVNQRSLLDASPNTAHITRHHAHKKRQLVSTIRGVSTVR